jgi:hypothetical protein
VGNNTAEALYTTTAQTVMTASTLSVGGNTTAQTFINSTAVVIGNTTAGIVNTYQATVTSNTLLLGTNAVVGTTSALVGANGYNTMPNKFVYAFGSLLVNSTTAAQTFTTAAGGFAGFTVNCFSFTATSNSATASFQAGVTALSKTGFTLVTAAAANVTVYWSAIGI